MDKESRTIEIMKISALLTLAECALEASPTPYNREDMSKIVDRLFRGYMEQFQSGLNGLSPQKGL